MKKILSGIACLVTLFMLTATSSYSKTFDQMGGNIQNNLMLRKIGHQFLTRIGDKTSQVLPVEELTNGGLRLPFSGELAIMPDSLVNIVQAVVKAGNFPQSFTITLTDTKTGKIVYGFNSSDLLHNTVPCLGRLLPKASYAINLYISDASQSTSTHTAILIAAIFSMLLAITIFSYFRHKIYIIKQLPTPISTYTKPGTIPLGRYTLDPVKRLLMIDHEEIALTTKETTLLNILGKKINQIMDRNTLLKEGWENEGVITGRSLDMYVSKLRKKLEKDPLIKITNFHGRGYSLEIQPE